MAIPQIMSRIWDGDPNEYFQASDMRRVEDNVNIVSRYAGVPEAVFKAVGRADQFDYEQAQLVESQTKKVADHLRIPIRIETAWSFNRTVSCVDFERWEANVWVLYKALGGVGERIPSDKFLHTVNLTLFANSWKGSSPFYQDFDLPALRDGMSAVAFVAETADVDARTAEFNARMQMVPTGPQRVRVWAYGIRPKADIPVRVTTREFKMYRQVILRAGSWQGSGPWTQTVDVGHKVANAIVGSDERNNATQVGAMADAVIGVSRIEGTRVTLRAINVKPTVDVNATVMWSESAVV